MSPTRTEDVVQSPRLCECEGNPTRPLWCGLCLGVLPTGADFAALKAERDALRDALSGLVTIVEDDPGLNDPEIEPDAYAALCVAKGALGQYGAKP